MVEVQKKVDLLKKEQKKRDHLAEMIQKMESKLLAGGGMNVADRADEAKRAREKVRQEMIEHKVSEKWFLLAIDFTFLLSFPSSVVRERFVSSLRLRKRVPWRSKEPSPHYKRKLTQRQRS